MYRTLFFQISILTVFVLVLSACGQGYTPQKYYGTPYGNKRTAGSGIEYVRANLAAPKKIKMERKNEIPMISTSQAEKLFKEFQSKPKRFKLETMVAPHKVSNHYNN